MCGARRAAPETTGAAKQGLPKLCTRKGRHGCGSPLCGLPPQKLRFPRQTSRGTMSDRTGGVSAAPQSRPKNTYTRQSSRRSSGSPPAPPAAVAANVSSPPFPAAVCAPQPERVQQGQQCQHHCTTAAPPPHQGHVQRRQRCSARHALDPRSSAPPHRLTAHATLCALPALRLFLTCTSGGPTCGRLDTRLATVHVNPMLG